MFGTSLRSLGLFSRAEQPKSARRPRTRLLVELAQGRAFLR